MGVWPKPTVNDTTNDLFNGKSFVITGSLSKPREEFKKIIVVNVDSDQSHNKYFEAVKKYENCTVLYNDPDKGRGRGETGNSTWHILFRNRKSIIKILI